MAVSALTGKGLPRPGEAIDARISRGTETTGYDVPASDGVRLAWSYEHSDVVGRDDADGVVHITVRLRPGDRARFERHADRGESHGASRIGEAAGKTPGQTKGVPAMPRPRIVRQRRLPDILQADAGSHAAEIQVTTADRSIKQ